MQNVAVPVVTIDGVAGAGKGSVAKRLAGKLQYHYLDSGALYRALAWRAHQQHVASDALDTLVNLCAGMQVRFELREENDEARVLLDDRDISASLRTEACAARASRLAVHPQIRLALLAKQHAFRVLPGLVAAGRDMGTVVFADAGCKVFLTADIRERARRRQKQLKKQGINAKLATFLSDLKARDMQDQRRVVSPLRPAADAVLVDTTELSIDQVVRRIARAALKKF